MSILLAIRSFHGRSRRHEPGEGQQSVAAGKDAARKPGRAGMLQEGEIDPDRDAARETGWGEQPGAVPQV